MTTGTPTARDERVTIRLARDELRVLREAAARHALPIAAFARMTAVRAARQAFAEAGEHAQRALR